MWGLQAKLMHDPPSFDSIRSSVPIENQSLPHPYDLPRSRIHHQPIFPGSFPVPGCRRPIGPEPRRVLPVTEAEEVPLVRVQLCHLFIHRKINLKNMENRSKSRVTFLLINCDIAFIQS